MGACDVYFTIGKQITSLNELKGYLRKKQEEDREYNGHQEGYSGDFQTIDGIKTDFNTVFTSFNEALDYCLKNTEKWGTALAVHYHEVSVPFTKTETTIAARIKKLESEIEQIRIVKKKTGHTKCSNCGSRLANTYLRRKWCPMCENILLSDREKKSIDKKQLTIAKLTARLTKIEQVQKEKAIAKLGVKNVKTLIAGWAAC